MVHVMSQAICPHCSRKVLIPEGLAPGTVMQCASCQSQFLPPVVQAAEGVALELKRKKKKRKREKPAGMQSNTKVVIGIFVAIGLLLCGVALYFLVQPGHQAFNDAISQSYGKFQTILQGSVQAARPPNPMAPFLKQFQTLDEKLLPLIEEVKKLKGPEDTKNIQANFVSMLEAFRLFSKQTNGALMEKLKKNPNDKEVLQEIVVSLVSIGDLHQSFLSSQNSMANRHRLFAIQPSPNQPFFMSPASGYGSPIDQLR